MIGPLTFLDAILIVIALVSGLLAMYRGLTREVLSILSWALAAIAALIFALNYRSLANDVAINLGIDKTIALILCAVALFLVVLLIVHFITSRFSEMVLDSRVGALDRTLGFVFGLARGFLLVVILYFFAVFLFEQDEEKHPFWVTQSQTLPLIKDTGHTIINLLKKVMPDQIKLPEPEKDPTSEQQSLNIKIKGFHQKV